MFGPVTETSVIEVILLQFQYFFWYKDVQLAKSREHLKICDFDMSTV